MSRMLSVDESRCTGHGRCYSAAPKLLSSIAWKRSSATESLTWSSMDLSVGMATSGSICQMVNSLSGAPYPLPIGEAGASSGVLVDGEPLVRLGDMIPSGPGVLQILGPPAAPYITDENPP